MAKSSRGGMTNYEKQDMIYSQFQRIIRKSEWEERNPERRELTQVEKILKKSREDKAKFQKKHAERLKKESVRVSFYNPNNPLNGSSTWSKEQHAEYKKSQKNQNS